MSKIQETTKTTSKGTTVTLFSPGPEHAGEILETMRVIIASHAHLLVTPEEFTYTVEQEAEIVQKHLDHPDKVMIVPRIDGRIVGMMNFGTGVRKRITHFGTFGISLLPEFTGRGIGAVMMDALIAWARENPRIETIRLQVHAKNRGAYQMYRDFGFLDEGREVRGVKFADGTYDDVIAMALHVK